MVVKDGREKARLDASPSARPAMRPGVHSAFAAFSRVLLGEGHEDTAGVKKS